MFDAKYWENEIVQSCNLIDNNLNLVNKENRSLVSANILNSLRNLNESISAFLLTKLENEDFSNRYDAITKSINYLKTEPKFKFLLTFHDCLQISLSHYTLYGEYAERIMLKYVEFLVKIKNFLQIEFSIFVLNNLNKLPLDLDTSLENYYRNIKEVLDDPDETNSKSGTNTYYIQKKKPIYIDGVLFYEYTLTDAFDNVSKFDRFIAFSKIDMFDNYAVRCLFDTKKINIFGKDVPVTVMKSYWVAIRPCELSKFSNIFGHRQKFTRTEQYERLMDYIKNNHLNLSKILEYQEIDFESFLNFVKGPKNQSSILIKLLIETRKFLSEKITGYNVVKYLSSIFTNSIIKKQLSYEKNPNVSNLYLDNRVLVFERTPFSGSLINHNPSFKILINLFDANEYEDDIFANHILNSSNETASIYIAIDKNDIPYADKLINKYNDRIPSFQKNRELKRIGNNIYIQENETDSLFIINELIQKTRITNFPNYRTFIQSILDAGTIQFDDHQKQLSVQNMFANSSLFCIYGAAGTGKSTLISKELSALGKISKLCLTNTHPALQNMERKLNDSQVEYKTVKKFISKKHIKVDYDVVVIDECSNISSRDMRNVLKKVRAKLFILAGDIYQLPAIQFGNWFALLRNFLNKYCYIDLFHVYRCKEDNPLITIWDKVRKIDPTMQDTFATFKISHILNGEIFKKSNDDEIVLTLNYDGLYGINNLNKLLQISNPSAEIKWKQYIFKIGDPIIFNETDRFEGHLYNNLKGTIKDIKILENLNIEFCIEVETVLNPLLTYPGFIFMNNTSEGKSLIKLVVLNSNESDYDDDTNDSNKVPFEIAYAISIHKAQGLEYKSVKIIVTKEVEEEISHNVFYTAITRAKESLTIFWSPESENYIVKSFELKNVNKDAKILANKFGLTLI